MLPSIRLKLIAAFLLISIIGTALAMLLTYVLTVQEFNQLVFDQAQRQFVAEVSNYYRVNGALNGLADQLRRRTPLPPMFLFTDLNGFVVVSVPPFREGERVPDGLRARGVRVEVDGRLIGFMLPPDNPPPLDPREQQYLARTNRALLLAALGATALALLGGIVLSRTLTNPLRELTRAIRAMAQGKLKQQVSIPSRDELGALTIAFNQMSADLDHANRLRRQMTADIAHDLRTPLTVIGGYVEALRDGVLEPTRTRFETIHNEIQHLQRLVEDLRVLSLADAGELKLNRQPTSLQTFFARMVTAYEPLAAQKHITLQHQVEPDLPSLAIDPERLAQVMGNLIGNALRHTPAGGQIILSARCEGDAIALEVRDNGEGIAPDVLLNIFERFYRGDAARAQAGGESGLGLTIAKAIVVAHGGAIAATSAVGHGTAITIHLKLDDALPPHPM
jgi:signal transduction histidine kinase